MPLETGPEAILGASDRGTRRCPRCGDPFQCGARSDSCWCDEVVLSERARAELRALRLVGCLCRACLESLG